MLRAKLRQHLLLFALIPMVTMIILSVPPLVDVVRKASFREITANVNHVSDTVDIFFFGSMFSRAKFAQSQMFQQPILHNNLTGPTYQVDPAIDAANDLLKNHVESTSELDGCMIIDTHDIVHAASLPQFVGRSFSQDYVAQGDVGTRPYVSSVQPAGSISGMPFDFDTVMMGTPLEKDGEVIGRFVGIYNTRFFTQTAKTASAQGTSIAVFDKSGNLIADGSSLLTQAVLASPQGKTIQEKIKEIEKNPKASIRFTLKIQHKSYDCVIGYAKGAQWPILALADRSALNAPIYKIVIVISIAALICIIISFFVAQEVLDRLIGPLEKEFVPAIYRVANGDRKARITYDREDEIGMVAHALNDLMADLGEREVELRTSEVRYRIILEGSDYIVWEWDANTDSIIMSDLFAQRFGYEPDLTRASQTFPISIHVHPDDADEYRHFRDDIFVNRVDSVAVFRFKKVDGEYVWVRGKSIALYNQSHECYGAIGAFADIDAAKKEELRLTEQVRTDTVSQVLTRKAFEDATTDLMNQLNHNSSLNKEMSICFVDIDDFKNFNTKYGHAFGDRVIRFFGEVLTTAVGTYGYAGRVGGDEFALCFAVCEGEPTCDDIVASIHEQLSEGLRTRDDEENIIISASIGIAHYPQDGANYEELMHQADLDMYDRKQTMKTQNRLQELKLLEATGEEEAT